MVRAMDWQPHRASFCLKVTNTTQIPIWIRKLISKNQIWDTCSFPNKQTKRKKKRIGMHVF